MKPVSIFALAAAQALLTTTLLAQNAERNDRAYPPDMPGARSEVYKTAGDVELKLYIYEPRDLKPGDARPAAVFFFGGGWRAGSPRQFARQCEYLASRGMVAIAADYRVASRHGVKAVDCVRDAKSAIRYVRKNAERLHVDPQRIAAGGGSAGGHLAAAAGTITDFDEPGEDTSISSRPNALLLFNPAVVLVPIEGVQLDAEWETAMPARTGVPPQQLSPYHHIDDKTPPTAIFHGTADPTVPYATVVAFTEAMKKAGRPCTLHGYEGQRHGFFNGRGPKGTKMFAATLTDADKFLAGLGYLQGEPTVEAFIEQQAAE